MDIKEQINKIVDKIKNDPSIAEKFKTNPIQAVESIIGVDLPDDVVNKIVDGVKAKMTADSVSGAVSSIKGLFGKK